MINIRKGTAHSLQQTDTVAKVVASEGVIAGMVVFVDPTANTNTGGVKLTTDHDNNSDKLVGFAINNQFDGDVLASGKLGVYLLDGDSIVESDQWAGSTPTTADIGKKACVSDTNGKFDVVSGSITDQKVLGTIVDVRTLPSVTVPAGYPA